MCLRLLFASARAQRSAPSLPTCAPRPASRHRHFRITQSKKSAPIVAHNLVEVIAGRTPNQAFDGYTSCPLITREGSAMLIEFDYEGRFTPSLPMIEPLQDSFFAWLLKLYMLKPAYLAVLKGRV